MVGGNLRDIINKAKKRAFGGDKPAPVNPPNEEYINKALKKADDKEDEFNAEKGTVDVFLANGDTLNGLINGSTKKGSVQGKYMAYLEKKIKDAREHIKDLKNEDKFYRREFIAANPLILIGDPFWKNMDNWILMALWSAVIAILAPTSMAVFGLPITGTQQMSLILAMWLVFPLFLLYILQNFA
jgi:hypothetical protein